MPLPAFLTGNTQRQQASAVILASTAAAMLVSGCSSNSSESTASTSAAPATSSAPAALFKLTHDWSFLASLHPKTITMKTEDDCLTKPFWEDEDGKREPMVQADPPVVTVDSSCNSPLTSAISGMYYTAAQIGPAPIKVHNGDPMGIECVETTDGEPIQDVRGPSSSSATWLGGVVFQDGQIKLGFYPETNAGYVDESKLAPCQKP